MPGSEMNAGLDARHAQLRAVAVPGPGSWKKLPPLVGSSDVKFEPRGPALGPKSDPTGLLPGLNASCLAHAGINSSSLMLKGYTAGLDAGHRNECWA